MQMKPLAVLFVFAAALVPIHAADEAVVTISAELPDGTIFAQAEDEVSESNNAWKWQDSGEPGARRDLGQRFVVEYPVTLRKIALRLATIPGAAGADAENAQFTISILKLNGSGVEEPETLLQVKGKLPAELPPGHRLVIEIPATGLDASAYAFLLAFDSPAAARTLNIATTSRRTYGKGPILFRSNSPDANALAYELRKDNLVFALFGE